MKTNGEEVKPDVTQRPPFLRIAALTFSALLIHGYHLGVEDGEIYIPTAKKLLHPALYPFGTEFFLSHGHLSVFGPVVALTSFLTRLPIDWSVFAWYVITLFGMLASCWFLLKTCFTSPRAHWSGMLVVTAVLAMPATNTGLLLIDPYLTARSFSTPLTLFALTALLERKYALSTALILLTALFHPQMVIYLLFLAIVIRLADRATARERVPAMASGAAIGVLPANFDLKPAVGAYREALYSRDYYFLQNWSWYHWLGLLAPLAIMAWFWRGNVRGARPAFSLLSFVMLPFGLLSIAVGLLFASSPAFDMFARLQPLRTFHLITLVLVLLLGGVFGEYVAKGRAWTIPALVTPLAIGMFFVARSTYPNSPQVELPAQTSSNAWVNALLWIRNQTPPNAVFAVDSHYFLDPGVDVHGFRAISERSALADYVKDGGVVAQFPALADEWKQMSTATTGLNHFATADFKRLKAEYPEVNWTVVHGDEPAGLDCPYHRQGYAVCQLP
ncbi:MAG TPA: hypothetical protein VGJ21_12065 [Terracidiphilus sp.]|jgi:hypothetical protein